MKTSVFAVIIFLASFCNGEEKNASLLFVKRHDLCQIFLNDEKIITVRRGNRDYMAGLAIDRTGLIYWNDINFKEIRRAQIDKADKDTKFLDSAVTKSIAFDWIFNHIFYTNIYNKKNSIEVTDLTKVDRTVIVVYQDSSQIPEVLAVDPEIGWLFWAETGQRVRLVKGAMDGSSKPPIPIVESMIGRPSGLTLDLVQQRVYWTDIGRISISYVNYDGTGRAEMSLKLKTPALYISVYRDWIYWTQGIGLFKAIKHDGSEKAMVKGRANENEYFGNVLLYAPYKSYAKRCQDGDNCLCVPAPRINATYQPISCKCLKSETCTMLHDAPNPKRPMVIYTTTTTTKPKIPPPAESNLDPNQSWIPIYNDDKGTRRVFCFSIK